MLGKVLLLSASAGAGHLRAAQAIERALSATGAARDVRHIDTLDYTNPVFRRLYSRAYIEMVNRCRRSSAGSTTALDKPEKDDRLSSRSTSSTRGRSSSCCERVPAGYHRLHALPAGRDHLVAHGEGQARDPAGDRRDRLRRPCAVALPELRALLRRDRRDPVHLEELGVPADKVTVSGIPIDPAFAEPKDKAAMRRKHGLAPDDDRDPDLGRRLRRRAGSST